MPRSTRTNKDNIPPKGYRYFSKTDIRKHFLFYVPAVILTIFTVFKVFEAFLNPNHTQRCDTNQSSTQDKNGSRDDQVSAILLALCLFIYMIAGRKAIEEERVETIKQERKAMRRRHSFTLLTDNHNSEALHPGIHNQDPKEIRDHALSLITHPADKKALALAYEGKLGPITYDSSQLTPIHWLFVKAQIAYQRNQLADARIHIVQCLRADHEHVNAELMGEYRRLYGKILLVSAQARRSENPIKDLSQAVNQFHQAYSLTTTPVFRAEIDHCLAHCHLILSQNVKIKAQKQVHLNKVAEHVLSQAKANPDKRTTGSAAPATDSVHEESYAHQATIV